MSSLKGSVAGLTSLSMPAINPILTASEVWFLGALRPRGYISVSIYHFPIDQPPLIFRPNVYKAARKGRQFLTVGPIQARRCHV